MGLEFLYEPSGRITAAVFCGLAVIISLANVGNHLFSYREPVLQRYAIRILLMVPVYGTCSLVSLLAPSSAFWLSTFRSAEPRRRLRTPKSF